MMCLLCKMSNIRRFLTRDVSYINCRLLLEQMGADHFFKSLPHLIYTLIASCIKTFCFANPALPPSRMVPFLHSSFHRSLSPLLNPSLPPALAPFLLSSTRPPSSFHSFSVAEAQQSMRHFCRTSLTTTLQQQLCAA